MLQSRHFRLNNFRIRISFSFCTSNIVQCKRIVAGVASSACWSISVLSAAILAICIAGTVFDLLVETRAAIVVACRISGTILDFIYIKPLLK
jgi:hypothetical protein